MRANSKLPLPEGKSVGTGLKEWKVRFSIRRGLRFVTHRFRAQRSSIVVWEMPMNNTARYFIVTLLAAAMPISVSAQNLSQTCTSPSFPSAETAIDSACGVAGSGGKEAAQNTAKNNFCAQGDTQAITFDKLKNLQTRVDNDHSIPFGRRGTATRHPGPATKREALDRMGEGNLVVLEAFVLKARQEGAESVNCASTVSNDPTNHDIHIALVATKTESNECNAIVAEMSPHHRPADWTAENVNKVAAAQASVKVTGQLFFDSSHSPCDNAESSPGDPKRFSLWEIHPIYKFEVCTGQCDQSTGWQSLSDWLRIH